MVSLACYVTVGDAGGDIQGRRAELETAHQALVQRKNNIAMEQAKKRDAIRVMEAETNTLRDERAALRVFMEIIYYIRSKYSDFRRLCWIYRRRKREP